MVALRDTSYMHDQILYTWTTGNTYKIDIGDEISVIDSDSGELKLTTKGLIELVPLTENIFGLTIQQILEGMEQVIPEPKPEFEAEAKPRNHRKYFKNWRKSS